MEVTGCHLLDEAEKNQKFPNTGLHGAMPGWDNNQQNEYQFRFIDIDLYNIFLVGIMIQLNHNWLIWTEVLIMQDLDFNFQFK